MAEESGGWGETGKKNPTASAENIKPRPGCFIRPSQIQHDNCINVLLRE
jgi:hypothetical protein